MKKIICFFVSTTFFWSAPSVANAYVDPGSTMLLLQGALALVGGIIMFIKHPIVTIKKMFSKIFKSKND